MRSLNTFYKQLGKIKVGDIILFQEYKDSNYNEPDIPKEYTKVSKPIYAIYMGLYVYDMALVMKYCRVPKEFNKEQSITLQEHVEWGDFIDILGKWTRKPMWKTF